MITIRLAIPSDSRSIYEIAMSPSVRSGSTRSDEFTFEAHDRWFAARLADSSTLIYVADDGRAVQGYLRYGKVDGKDEAEIAVAVAESMRRAGVATLLTQRTLSTVVAYFGRVTLVALVVKGNDASDALFRSLGFTATGDEERLGKQHTRWEFAGPPRLSSASVIAAST